MFNINQEIDAIYDEIVAIRRDFHAYPELSEQEVRTAAKVSSYLTAWGIPHETGIAGHGIVATLEGKQAPAADQAFTVVGIRADMDALPIAEKAAVPFCSTVEGVMHACGHDMHTAILLGAAKILKAHENELPGTVKFFFQPAEETVGGAKPLIDAGCLENPKVDGVLALHVAPTMPVGIVEFCPGKMNAASTEFQITVEGTSCHGAHPDLGVDPILAACHVVTALQSIVSRTLSPTNAGLVTVGQFHGGHANNVIPKEVLLSGIIRALDNDTRALLKEKVQLVATQTAQAFGAKADIVFKDSYPALVNDDDVQEIIKEVAYSHLPKSAIHFMPEPSLGADDFSYFTNATKALYFNIGTKSPNETHPQTLHSEWFNPDESAMKVGMLMEVMGVLALLNHKKGNEQ